MEIAESDLRVGCFSTQLLSSTASGRVDRLDFRAVVRVFLTSDGMVFSHALQMIEVCEESLNARGIHPIS